MTQVKENAVEGAATAGQEVKAEGQVKKVNRRGIGTARGTTRLKFSHEQANRNGLFIGHLDSVVVSMIQIGDDKTGMPSFNGLEIPKLTITFASNEEDANKRHYQTLTFTAVESNANTIPGGKEEWKVNSVFDWLKHILNVYVLKGRDLTDDEAAALSLSFEDFDEQGEYVSIEPENVIVGWKTLFENFENIINRGRDGQPYYKSKDGKNIAVWLKMLRYIKTNKKGWNPINNGDLSFPSFVGEGCIEIYKQNTPPSIRVDSVKEAIIPMNIEKPKQPNMPAPGMAAGMAPAMGGVPVTDPMVGASNFGGIATEAAEDMPF
ncbi:MAG: hypothetical protein [Bacteriophage sp.]|nr:MAG: hypothetical protein [Bacteriophage sp.]